MKMEAVDSEHSKIVSSLTHNDCLYFVPKFFEIGDIGLVKAIKKLELDITIYGNNHAIIKADGILSVCGGTTFSIAMSGNKVTTPFIDTHIRNTYFIEVPTYKNTGMHVLKEFSIISSGNHIIREPDISARSTNAVRLF